VPSKKVRIRGVCNAYVLKTLVPNRDRGTSTVVNRGKQNLQLELNEPEDWQAPVYHHVIDLSSKQVRRKASKQCFKHHPSQYLGMGRDSKLDPGIQAAFQAAGESMRKLREIRMYCTRAICQGKEDVWRRCLNKLKSVLRSLGRYDRHYIVNTILRRYVTWCISEVHSALRRVFIILGNADDKLRFCRNYEPIRIPAMRGADLIQLKAFIDRQ
jgi:hypothetical protein